MGIVWLAEDEDLEILVALKVLPEHCVMIAPHSQALKRETKLGRLLAHPNIVRIYDFQRDDNAAAISMEYVDGAAFPRSAPPNRRRSLIPQLCTYTSNLCAMPFTMPIPVNGLYTRPKTAKSDAEQPGGLENCRLRYLPQHQRIHHHVDGEGRVVGRPSLHKSSAVGWRSAYSPGRHLFGRRDSVRAREQ